MTRTTHPRHEKTLPGEQFALQAATDDTILRALTISAVPVAPLDWPTLWSMLHISWNAVQRAANAAMREWLRSDPATLTVNEKTGKIKLEKFGKDVLNATYHAARAAAPELPSGSVADVCQRVSRRYQADRWAVRVAGRKSVPTFARPLPLSIRTQDWQLAAVEKETGRAEYLARFALLDMKRDARPTLALVVRSARDAELLAKIANGEFERRTIELLPPGWDRRGPLRVKLVYRRPRVERSRATGTLVVTTGAPSLLSAIVVGREKKERPFCWNLRWLRARILVYEQRRHEDAEDRKNERRCPARRRQVYRRNAGRAANKQGDRVTTELQTLASQTAAYAARRGCKKIVYDDTDRSWVSPFPWEKLRTLLSQAAEVRGLMIVFFSGDGLTGPGRCQADESGESLDASTADTKPCDERSSRKKEPM